MVVGRTGDGGRGAGGGGRGTGDGVVLSLHVPAFRYPLLEGVCRKGWCIYTWLGGMAGSEHLGMEGVWSMSRLDFV